MIAHIEFVPNDLADRGRSPDAGVQTVSDGAAIPNVRELLALAFRQAGGPSAAVAFPQAFLAIAVPVLDPERHGAAMHFELVGNVAGSVSVQTHEHALHAQEQAWGFFPRGFPANLQKLGNRLAISSGKYRAHICRVSIAHSALMSNYLCADILTSL